MNALSMNNGVRTGVIIFFRVPPVVRDLHLALASARQKNAKKKAQISARLIGLRRKLNTTATW